MTINQINYFLTLSNTLNYSKAAKLLFISQPALSRQIILMEDELNIKLFNRDKSLKLTKAGSLLAKEFGTMMELYYGSITRARNMDTGMSTQLKVGILDGLAIDDLLEPTLNRMHNEHPDIDVVLFTCGYGDLVEQLYEGRLDIIASRKFDIEPREGLDYKILEPTEDFLVFSNIPKFEYIQDPIQLENLSGETLVFLMGSEYDMSKKTITEFFSTLESSPILKGVSTYHSSMQWVKSGLCITIADQRSVLPPDGIRAVPLPQFRDPSIVLAWSQTNENQSRAIFAQMALDYQQTPANKFEKHISARWKSP